MEERFESIGSWAAYAIPLSVTIKDNLKALTKICEGKDIDLRHFLTITHGLDAVKRFTFKSSPPGVIPINKALIILKQYNYQ